MEVAEINPGGELGGATAKALAKMADGFVGATLLGRGLAEVEPGGAAGGIDIDGMTEQGFRRIQIPLTGIQQAQLVPGLGVEGVFFDGLAGIELGKGEVVLFIGGGGDQAEEFGAVVEGFGAEGGSQAGGGPHQEQEAGLRGHPSKLAGLNGIDQSPDAERS